VNEMPIKAGTECWLKNAHTGVTIPAIYTGNAAFPWDIPGITPAPSWFFMDSAGWAFDRIVDDHASTQPVPTDTAPAVDNGEIEALKVEYAALQKSVGEITTYANSCESALILAVRLILSRRAQFVKEPQHIVALAMLENLVGQIEAFRREDQEKAA
jgi:hypothetical protein